MKARVKDIPVGVSAATPQWIDRFVPGMRDFIGKELKFTEMTLGKEVVKDWWTTRATSFNFHISWLEEL